MIWRLIYNTIGIAAIFVGFQVASLFNSKIRRGISARKNSLRQLEEQLELVPDFTKRVWFHFTSVGEFEQAKPLIESIKENTQIAVRKFFKENFGKKPRIVVHLIKACELGD